MNPENIEKHKFKKGVSGNPKGRPKKLPELDVLLADVLGDEQNGVTAAAQVLKAMLARAKRGDVKAAALLFDRGYGKPKDNEGKPTQLIVNVIRRG